MSLRILLVNTIYPPEIVGGAEVSVSLLAEALARRDHDVAVVCLHKDREPVTERINGVRVRRLPIDNVYWPFQSEERRSAVTRLSWHVRDTWNRRAARRFAAILESERPDVVHTNNLTGLSVSLWREAKVRGIRIVHTTRDYSLLCKRSTLFHNGHTCETRCSVCNLMTKPYFHSSRLVDALASNSQYVLDRHLSLGYFPDTPTRVIYNIANFNEFARLPRTESSDLTFGYIGRIEPEKGIDVVLAATRALPDRGWKLRIAGRGKDNYVRDLKAAYPNDRIEWLGFTKSRDFYASVDVCLISSVWPEPLPRTLIESIAAGRATICSDAGGIPEISAHSDLVGVYPAEDSGQLADLMRQALADPQRWKQARPAAETFSAAFSEDAIVGEYLKLYCANSSPSARDHLS